MYKYDIEVYNLLCDTFDSLPLMALVNNKFLCIHGGLSPSFKILDDIKVINRFQEIAKKGIFCDIFWSDPVDNEEGICEGFYRFNDSRGCSYYFGYDVTKKFLENNQLISIIRSN